MKSEPFNVFVKVKKKKKVTNISQILLIKKLLFTKRNKPIYIIKEKKQTLPKKRVNIILTY